jgi:hypothetical protein
MRKFHVGMLFVLPLFLNAQSFKLYWIDSIAWDDGQLKYNISYQTKKGTRSRELSEAWIFPHKKFKIQCENATVLTEGVLKPTIPQCKTIRLTVELLKTGEQDTLLVYPPNITIEKMQNLSTVTPGQLIKPYPKLMVNGEEHHTDYDFLLQDYFAIWPEKNGMTQTRLLIPSDYKEPFYTIVLKNRCNAESRSFHIPVIFNQVVQVVARGENGNSGYSGNTGNFGSDGRDGGAGSPGSPGRNGGAGGNIQMEIRRYEESLFEVVVKGLWSTQTHYLDFSKGAGLVVDLQGGNGGEGGNGGKGGGGGDGRAGDDHEANIEPGYGGNGGRGGDGGFGGNGGRLTVYADSAAMKYLNQITLNNAGGKGGEGGEGGSGGSGGSDPNSKRLIDILFTGRRGNHGPSGRDGQPGLSGPVMDVRKL